MQEKLNTILEHLEILQQGQVRFEENLNTFGKRLDRVEQNLNTFGEKLGQVEKVNKFLLLIKLVWKKDKFA
ncbi:hypothetical protein KFZ58_02300 [Virgibacillus sp. NKC19-16]|uniref:hypothetical protein n=1 Tax=Virgibacillus salidurans TaxID=2831673 RepID=UPI001F2AF22D|nr:hypothetical protein [Virgibacillus sp. NKC19-16]UJL46807.1 hypothetical protein KFZ58_02300 [Virgibacillus sp. NKC19-16]